MLTKYNVCIHLQRLGRTVRTGYLAVPCPVQSTLPRALLSGAQTAVLHYFHDVDARADTKRSS